jgi:hypothetical protein
LHWAARNGHVDTAELLLESGAELEARDRKELTAEDWALGRGHCDVANLIKTWRRNKMERARASSEQVMKRVVEKQVRERQKEEVSLITCRSWEVMQGSGANEDVVVLLSRGRLLLLFVFSVLKPIQASIRLPRKILLKLVYTGKILGSW